MSLIEELNITKLYCHLPKKDTWQEYIISYLEDDCPSTFNEDKTLQCISGKTRSLESLYRLAIGLYDDVDFEEFVRFMSDLAVEWNAAILSCNTAKNVTFHRGDSAEAFNWNKPEWSELGLVPSDSYKIFGKYSTYDLFNIITREND